MKFAGVIQALIALLRSKRRKTIPIHFQVKQLRVLRENIVVFVDYLRLNSKAPQTLPI